MHRQRSGLLHCIPQKGQCVETVLFEQHAGGIGTGQIIRHNKAVWHENRLLCH